MRRKLAVVLLAVLALSALTVALVDARGMMGQSDDDDHDEHEIPVTSNRWINQSWVRVDGVITKWGDANVTGFLSVFSKSALLNTNATRELVQASAIWTTNGSHPISAVKSKDNFTLSFYVAKLINASTAGLGGGATNFFLNGTWNVYNVTSVVTITTNADGEITRVHRDQDVQVSKVNGELNVTDNWTKFKLTLTGLDPLTGSVVRSMTRQKQFNLFKVSDEDEDEEDNFSEKVTRADIVTVKRSYGAMPGWGNFDQKLDFNGNYRIDIADLTTVAANT